MSNSSQVKVFQAADQLSLYKKVLLLSLTLPAPKVQGVMIAVRRVYSQSTMSDNKSALN